MQQELLWQYHVDRHEILEYLKLLLSFCSIIKQSGAAISSRLIPPNVPLIF